MGKKLEETFNLPETKAEIKDEIKTMKKDVKSEKAKIISVEDLNDHDEKMDDYATHAFRYAKEIFDLGMDVEPRHGAEMFNAAANMLKVAAESKNAKIEKRLKLYELELKKQKLEADQANYQGVTQLDRDSVFASREDLLSEDDED